MCFTGLARKKESFSPLSKLARKQSEKVYMRIIITT